MLLKRKIDLENSKRHRMVYTFLQLGQNCRTRDFLRLCFFTKYIQKRHSNKSDFCNFIQKAKTSKSSLVE